MATGEEQSEDRMGEVLPMLPGSVASRRRPWGAEWGRLSSELCCFPDLLDLLVRKPRLYFLRNLLNLVNKN